MFKVIQPENFIIRHLTDENRSTTTVTNGHLKFVQCVHTFSNLYDFHETYLKLFVLYTEMIIIKKMIIKMIPIRHISTVKTALNAWKRTWPN